MDVRLYSSKVLPSALLNAAAVQSSLTFRDLIALSAGHDFLLQASNPMCAAAAFNSLHLPWVTAQLDTQAVAALGSSGAVFTSLALAQAVAAPQGTPGATSEVLLLFKAHDVIFDDVDRCRVRLSVNFALGSMFVMPQVPGLAHTPKFGETVEQVVNRVRGLDTMNRLAQALLAAGTALTAQQPVMHTLSDNRSTFVDARVFSELERSVDMQELIRDVSMPQFNGHIELEFGTSFDVTAWLGGGLLEIPASFAAVGDASAKTIRVSADVHQSSPKFTELSHDAALLLSNADPLGLVQTVTQHVRRRSTLLLMDDISLVGGPANANAGHLGPLVADAFPCRTGVSPLNIGATVMPGRVAARNVPQFIGSSKYGVLWSADAVRLLVRYCWESSAFPRSIMQTQVGAVRLKIGGVEQAADVVSMFHLDTLDIIELEYDSNARRDILYTRGLGRVVPLLIRLQDGHELLPKDTDEALFAPSEPMPWAALGELTEEAPTASSADLLLFQKQVTRGVTSRLGRPFVEPPFSAIVTDSRLSAPAQRVALLVNASEVN
jgi:hypothetical protein